MTDLIDQKHPEGKFMATIKVGEKGQIVIPKGARDLFNIVPGDTILLLADIDRGIGLMKFDRVEDLTNAIFNITNPKGDKESDR